MSVMPEPTALDVATESELVAELAKRNAATLIMVSRDAKNDPGTAAPHLYWFGGFYAAAGLAKEANMHFTRLMRRNK